MREDVLADPDDGVAHLGRNLRRYDLQILHYNLNGLGPRRDGADDAAERSDDEYIPSRLHGILHFYLSAASTCSACCSWPWKIFRPVCSRLLSSALLADGMSVVSSALSTGL